MGIVLKQSKRLAVVLVAAVLVLAATGLVFLARMSKASATDEVISVPTSKVLYEGEDITISDLQVNGTGNDTLSMSLFASNGSLQFVNSDGLSFQGQSYGSNLQFSGTRTAINSALATLKYYADQPGTHTVEALLGGGNYWVENGHVYSVVPSPGISWQDAKVAAETSTYGGVNGYLATITSQEEHDFILERINDSGWIGANDIDEEGVWRWVTGPEAGMQFWSGAGNGTAFGGAFTNWNDSEPNDSMYEEDCGQIWFNEGSNGQWNDLNCASEENEYYVVEYGASGDLPAITTTDFEVTVNEAPEIAFTQLSPVDDGATRPIDTLSITFNQPMILSEGVLSVHDASDDSIVAQLNDGTTEDSLTFEFTLPEDLAIGKSYYVTISDSFFSGLVGYYGGFSDKTTWNFTVVDQATPNSGDANDDGVLDVTQDNVSGFINENTGKYVAIDVGAGCHLVDDALVVESRFGVQDAAFEYDNGLWDFEANCGTPGYTATISLYYYDITTSTTVLRKHNPRTNAYFTINDAEITTQTIGGRQVTVVTYAVTDGSERDVDGLVNGTIIDPAGLARLVVGAPNTGIR